MKIFLRIVRYIKPHRGTLAIANMLMLLFVVFNLLSIGLIMPLVDVVFNPPTTTEVNTENLSLLRLGEYISHHLDRAVQSYNRLDVLLVLTLGLVAAFLLKNLFWYMNSRFMARVEQNIMHTLRVDVYRHIHNLSLGYFTEERKGNLISSVINDVRIINDSVVAVINSMFRDPPQIMLYAVLLFLFDWQLTLLVFLLLPISGFAISRVADRLKKKGIESQEKMADMVSILDETLANVRIVKAFSMEEFEVSKFKGESSLYARIMEKIQRRRNLATPISEFFGVFSIAIILWFMGKGVIAGEGTMTPGGLLVYIGVITQMMRPLKLFGQVFNSVQEGIGAGERVFRLLDTKPKILDKPGARSIARFRDIISYENVTFRYETGSVVLRNVSCEIRAGETLAIVGPSGAGKSTFVDLLPRFYDPVEGRITIDGVDLRDLTVDSLRGLMGIVTQETILFNDTVRNNIAYGRLGVPTEKIIEAARVANAHNFITDLPFGYDTVIGDRGLKLSGGQRQRISLARAILKNPPILILDEATSALDTESEILVQEAVERVLAGRTSIVIAHRLSTVQHADRILVLDNGKLIEEGPHTELLRNTEGIYKRLYELQFQI
ncbi:MAG: ABC transporter ATP-binding protein [Ignavibacteria bacterium]|nr:ABC transporter ATP-binding protein [Ignavibacteria bacterium]